MRRYSPPHSGHGRHGPAGIRWYELRKSDSDGWSITSRALLARQYPTAGWAASHERVPGRLRSLLDRVGQHLSVDPVHGPAAGDTPGTCPRARTPSGLHWQPDHTYSAGAITAACRSTRSTTARSGTTTEYVATTGSAPWRTRIASFQFPGCSGTVDTPPSVSIANPTEGATVSGTVVVTADAVDDKGVTQVRSPRAGPVLAPTTMAATAGRPTWNTTSFADGSQTVTATATDTANQTSSDTHTVTVDNVADTVLHVGDLDGARTLGKNNWKGERDGDGARRSGLRGERAVVSFAWSGGFAAPAPAGDSGGTAAPAPAT